MVLKKTYSNTLKDSKEDYIQERTTAMEFCNKGGSLDSTLNTARKNEDLEPRNRVARSMDGKLLRGDIRGTGGFRLK